MEAKSAGVKANGWRSLLSGAIVLSALTGVIVLQRSQLARPSMWQSDPKQAEQQEAVKLRLIKQLPTLGFSNLIADWTFLNFLQYYGDNDVRAKTGYALSPQYFDIITRLDPRFVDIYLFLSGSISYQLGDPQTAVKLMDRGTAALSPQVSPKAFQVWRFKGLDQLLLLGDVPASIHSHEMAEKWVQGTPYQALAPLFQQTAEFLRRDPNSVPVRFQAWMSIYYQAGAAHDKTTQARAKREILALGGQTRMQDGELTFFLPEPQRKDSKAQQ
ncbi:hypothetical protein [Stenomitos frigidus]|uniref:Uncharacterized protein n=1 Tax=Stenomitos frigidus ULC18 TaxID=2107698 RepID=A0A2T1DZC6_9CYAN|nr:hypothetical protein [Stenomitos frigidus]PSB25853.1 hypothetical protein C7B82_21585 [Stenomitos frigidus ULC18]